MRQLLMFILLFVCIGIKAQVTLLPKQITNANKGVVFKKEWSTDLRLHTNGVALALNFGKIQTYYKTSYYHFEIGRLKDPRERSQNKNYTLTSGPTTNSFVFGKQNSVYALRGGWGRKIYWSEKAQKKGIAVGYTYEVGPSIALVKPYYLSLIYDSPTDGGGTSVEFREEKYTAENAEKFTKYDDIFGGVSFFKGITETSFVPGIQGKLAMHFALGAFDSTVKALECGFMFDIYSKKIPILIETEEVSNKPYFFNLYVNLQFGKRSIR